jgi:hypothetical protein
LTCPLSQLAGGTAAIGAHVGLITKPLFAPWKDPVFSCLACFVSELSECKKHNSDANIKQTYTKELRTSKRSKPTQTAFEEQGTYR